MNSSESHAGGPFSVREVKKAVFEGVADVWETRPRNVRIFNWLTCRGGEKSRRWKYLVSWDPWEIMDILGHIEERLGFDLKEDLSEDERQALQKPKIRDLVRFFKSRLQQAGLLTVD